MEWKEGNISTAKELYQRALSIDSTSESAARCLQVETISLIFFFPESNIHILAINRCLYFLESGRLLSMLCLSMFFASKYSFYLFLIQV